MALSFKVSIPQVNVRVSDDTIRVVHWRVNATDPAILDPETSEPVIFTAYGSESVPEATNVPYGTVTKAQVVNWLKQRPSDVEGQTLAQRVVASLNAQAAAFVAPVETMESKSELMQESDF